MQTEKWKKIKELLAEVLPLGASERRNFLDKSGVNGEIRVEVESLLAFEEESEDLMKLSAVEFSKDFFDTEEAAENVLIGQKFGVYKIVGELGYGGMGAVYLAERADGKFEQKVAVKMLKREFNIERIRRTFRREKEILAALSHPNIAHLLDAGKTDDNIPFLVMEYVEGVPVDEFCLENSLDTNARLKLFNKICDAVAFAHRNLIVHRDLKPSNILITKNGEPKLLDFGISKLLDDTDETSKNTTLLGAMTPRYASPEQLRGEIVSTATDIYSLGVVLAELVQSPKSKVQSPKSEIKIQNVKSTTGNDGKDKLWTLDFGLWTGSDLQAILQTAMREEVPLRYKSVEHFSDDLWRLIDGLPVAARPAAFGYRANKFFKRNKFFVIAGVLIFLSLITGIAAALWQADAARKQAVIASEAQQKAEQSAELANAEKEKAEKISGFMAEIISYANPAWYAEGGKFGGDAKMIDVLDDLSDKIDIKFADQPDVQAELHHKFTEVYNAVKMQEANPIRAEKFFEKQKFHARRALESRKEFYGEKHELVAKDLYYFGVAMSGDDPHTAEMFAEAIKMMRETNPKNLNLPYMLNDYAVHLMFPETKDWHEQYLKAAMQSADQNKYQLAESYLREALPLFRQHYKDDNVAILQNECNLAYSLALQNKMTEFERQYAVCSPLLDKFETGENYLKLIEDALKEKSSKFQVSSSK